MEATSEINAEGMKSFVKHLCRISKKHEQREAARGHLDQQLRKVKEITLTQKPRKWLIEKELKELERKITLALDNERKLIGMRQADSILIKQLKDELFSLEYQLKESEVMRIAEEEKNRKAISELTKAVAELRKKITVLIGREERIKKLEKRIKKRKS